MKNRIRKAILDTVLETKQDIDVSMLRLTIGALVDQDSRFEAVTLKDFLSGLYEIDPLEIDGLLNESE